MSDIVHLVSAAREDALRCLAYERSRAPSFPVALQRWSVGQGWRIRRLASLGPRSTDQLLRAESLAWQLGFAPAVAHVAPDLGVVAPWHFPACALTGPLTSWLSHPLIDPASLARPDADSQSVDLQPLLELLEGCLRENSLWQHPGKSHAPRTELPPARVAVVLHLYYPDLWPEFLEALSGFKEPWDLFVTVPVFACTYWLERIALDVPGVRFVPGLNRGRDVLPWLQLARTGELDRYELVCKLHTKRSPHVTDGARWRRAMLNGLIGDPQALALKLELLRADPAVGVAGPASLRIEPDDRRWLGSSAGSVARAVSVLGLQPQEARQPFIAGTMFWYRPLALRRLAEACGDPDLFEPEMGQTDGTFAHGTERLVGSVAHAAGYRLFDLPAF